MSFSGTQAVLATAAGGLALFTGLGNTLTITHTNTNVLDGFDLAFHVVEVPEPETLALVVMGLLALGLLGLKRVKRARAGELQDGTLPDSTL